MSPTRRPGEDVRYRSITLKEGRLTQKPAQTTVRPGGSTGPPRVIGGMLNRTDPSEIAPGSAGKGDTTVSLQGQWRTLRTFSIAAFAR